MKWCKECNRRSNVQHKPTCTVLRRENAILDLVEQYPNHLPAADWTKWLDGAIAACRRLNEKLSRPNVVVLEMRSNGPQVVGELNRSRLQWGPIS